MEYLPILIVFILYFSSIPIAFALFGASIFYFTFLDAGMPAEFVLQKFITATASFPLLAIPFFVPGGQQGKCLRHNWPSAIRCEIGS